MSNALDIPPFLDRRPVVYSYTFLNTYQNICPHQAWRRYIVRDIAFKETPAIRRGNEVHTAMEHRIGGKPLPLEMQKWEPFVRPFDNRGVTPELKLGITAKGVATGFFANDVWLRGKLDVPVVHDKTAYIADWKTGGSKYEDRFELDVGAVLLHAKFPHLETIKGQYIWLSEDRAGKPYDLSDTRTSWQKIGGIVRSIERDRQAGHFEKKRGPLCKWCPVGNCEFNENPDAQ